MMNQAIPLFRRQYLAQGAAESMTSEPVAAEGNEAVLSTTGINVESGTLTLSLEGSYDGVAWTSLVTATGLTDFGFVTAKKSALDVAWVRARAVVSSGGSSAKAIFDVTVSFSEQ